MKRETVHLGGTARGLEDVKRLHRLGLQFAEIPIRDPREFSAQVRAYRDLGRRLGMYYLCHGPREGDPNDRHGLTEEYLSKILGIFPLMQELQMSLLTLHLWFDPRFVREEMIRFKIGLLRRIIHEAAGRGITICLENLSETASHLKVPFQDLPLLNLALDLGHAELLSEVNTSYGFMEQYPAKIKHVHLHDNRGGDSYQDDLHLLPGEGIVDFERIFAGLREIGYNRTITLELKPPEIEKCLGRVKTLLAESGLLSTEAGDAK